MPDARLLAVNVGLPADVSWRGRTVHTGIWKRPLEGPAFVRRLNIDGDGQGDLAGHGGEHRAVFVYQIDSYRYWERQLGRADFTYGQFGENFTVEGLADDEVRIGDRYQIGDAVFEVSQPRVTCYRLGIRMDEPRMPALVVSHRRPGFYFRVLAEGSVEAGAPIVKIASGPEPVTVADVDGLLYLPGHRREGMAQALRIDALSPGWKASLRALLDEPGGSGGNVGLTAAAGAPPPAWSGFRPLRVTGVEAETPSVRSFTLESTDGPPLPAARPGQYVPVRVRLADGAAVVRNYSLSGPPGAAYRISVKRESHGQASRALHRGVAIGDVLDVGAPRGTFTLGDGAGPVVLVSAGVGVTPVLAMLYALAGVRSTRPVWWLHGARSRAEHAFAAEAARLLDGLPGARFHVCYSRPDAGDLDAAGVSAGRLSPELLGGLGLPVEADVYLCGPELFMAEIAGAFAASGVASSRLHTEHFGALAAVTPGVMAQPTGAPGQPDGPPGTGPLVTFARTGLTAPWDARYASLLELAEACRVPVQWACRTGVCHTCETGLVAGDVDYEPEPVEPPAAGNVLVCCARPVDEVVVEL
ncbi:MAG TPA: MOSC and FAD-binding oxidoreductase domain-containing protein [Acidimicrobiales bacterium]